MIKSAIILAGGLGTRLRSVVQDVPKPMAPIRGRPFLAYQLDYWIAQGINRFVLSVGYKHDLIQSFFGTTYQGAHIEYVIEQSPLGTGGGFLLALEAHGYTKPFLLLNGDTYFDVNLKHLTEFAVKQEADWVFSLFHTHNSARYMGMNVSAEGRVMSLKTAKNPDGCLASGGVYWVNPRALPIWLLHNWEGKMSLEDEFLPAALAADHRIFGFESQGMFIDIGLPEDYQRSATIL